jgi:hypothetical protein
MAATDRMDTRLLPGPRGQGLPHPPDPGTVGPVAPAWLHDGSVVREQSSAPVYVLFGGARFHIASVEEMAALGVTWAQVTVVPDGATTALARVPSRGTLLRDRSAPEVWISLGDRIYWIPSPEAMRFLGLQWSQIHIVPTGSLNGLPQTRLASASATPSSVVFAPDNPKHWARTDVPGVTLPNGSHVAEIRGWLRAVSATANGSDPDWSLQIEPDPAWLDAIGVNWATIFKVGDILAMGVNPLTNDADQHARAATPTFHIECNGWQDSKHPGVARPSDWNVTDANGGQLPGVVWPYLPTASGGRPGGSTLAVGQYVRVVGSLVHDIAHCHGQGGGFAEFWEHNFGVGAGSSAYNAAAQDWEGALTEFDQGDPARWTEIHPPDLIEHLPNGNGTDPQPPESVIGVTVVARAALTNPFGHDQELTVDLHPPANRPAHTKAAIREFVGPETRFGSITEGNTDHSGAAITLLNDRATIHVKVHGDGFAGAPGKFKAVYRLSWVPDPASYHLSVRMAPVSVPDGVSSTVTFNVVDAYSQQPVAGTVTLEGSQLGATNTPVIALFKSKTVRIWEPGDPEGPIAQRRGHWVTEQVPPTVTILANGYPSATFQVNFN